MFRGVRRFKYVSDVDTAGGGGEAALGMGWGPDSCERLNERGKKSTRPSAALF